MHGQQNVKLFEVFLVGLLRQPVDFFQFIVRFATCRTPFITYYFTFVLIIVGEVIDIIRFDFFLLVAFFLQ